MLRFMHEFPRIQTLAGVARTTYNQYDSLVLPLQRWLEERGVQFRTGCAVRDLDMQKASEKWLVNGILAYEKGKEIRIPVCNDDLVFMQNGSMTEGSSLGSMTRAPELRTEKKGGTWDLWKKVASRGPEFGNPEVFCGKPSESQWESFTVTLKDPAFFNRMEEFSGNKAGTGALVTFKDSAWLMSVVLANQPHFPNQPDAVQVFWGYGLFPDRIGNFVAKKMSECNGAEILEEVRGHLGFEADVFEHANCIPCMLPYITSQFLARERSDRPLPVPENSANLGFISQFVEIPDDVVFTVEYSVRAAQMAVYQLLGIEKKIPAISRYDRTLKVQLQSLKTAYRKTAGPVRAQEKAEG
jgi:oleate hydratase